DDDSLKILRNIKSLPRAVSVTLDGLTFDETRQMMVQCWADERMKGVTENIAYNLFQRSNGSPFCIKTLAYAFKETNQWQYNTQGIVTTKTYDFDFGKLSISSEIQSIAIAQFDRLNANFQLLLKIASALGQRFCVNDAFHFLKEMPGLLDQFKYPNLSEVCNVIRQFDKFGYLQQILLREECLYFEFKSAVVRRCIYSMMIDSQRSLMHMSIAQHYEKLYETTNDPELLKLIYKHYNATDDSQKKKKIKYLEKVSHLYYVLHDIEKTVKHYEILFEWVDRNGLQSKFEKATVAMWHCELGESYYALGRLDNASNHLTQALALLDRSLPRNRFLLSLCTKKEAFVRSQFKVASLTESLSSLSFRDSGWNRLNLSVQSLGKRESSSSHSARSQGSGIIFSNTHTKAEDDYTSGIVPQSKAFFSREIQDRHFYTMRAMGVLSIIYNLTGAMPESTYTGFRAMNIAEKFPKLPNYAAHLATVGLIQWSAQRKRGPALRYLYAADKADSKADRSTSIAVLLLTGRALFLMGMFSESLHRYQMAMKIAPRQLTLFQREEGLRYQAVILYLTGPLPLATSASKEFLAQSSLEGRSVGQFWGCYLMLANLLSSQSGAPEVRGMMQSMESSWQAVPAEVSATPSIRLARLGLLTLCDDALDMVVPSAARLRELEALSRALGPHDWRGTLGLHHAARVIVSAHQHGLISTDPADRRPLETFLSSAAKALDRMLTVAPARPLASVYCGLCSLIVSKSKPSAVRRWKAGLALAEVKELNYFKGLLLELVGSVSDDQDEANKCSVDALTIYQEIGAVADCERLTRLSRQRS
ncbi:hypothetical protein HK405_008372, partial [Cladochytrium tenue]